MKRLLLLVACALGIGMSATAQNRLDLSLSDAKKEWKGEKLTIKDNTISMDFGQKEENGKMVDDWGNAAVSWFNDQVTDISQYKYLVLKLEEASNANVEINLSQGGFWGTKVQSQHVLEQGKTEITLELHNLVCNMEQESTNEALDLTKINLIFLRTAWAHQQTIKIKEFYLTDKMNDTAQNRLDLSLSNAKKEWKEEKLTIKDNTISVDFGQKEENGKMVDDWGNAAVSWFNDQVTDISQYKYLVLKLEEASNANVEINLSQGGFWGTKVQSQHVLEQGKTEITLELHNLVCNMEQVSTNEALDLTKINLIFLRTGWVHQQTIKIKEFYLTDKISLFPLSDLRDIYNGTNTEVIQNEDGTATLKYNANDATEYWKCGWEYQNCDLSPYARLIIDFTTFKIEGSGEPASPTISLFLNKDPYISILSEENIAFEENMQRTMDLATLSSTQISDIKALWLTTNNPTLDRYLTIKGVTLATDYIRETAVGNYGTICLPARAEAVNATVYSIAGKDENGIYLEEVTDDMEAGVPYLFKAEADKVSFNYIGKATAEEASNKNGLYGTFAKSTITEGSYVLGTGNKLYKTKEGFECGTNRAYINLNEVPEISATGASIKLRFDLDGTTGINETESATKSNTVDVYNLQGVKVRNAVKANEATKGLEKGLYIINGKKIIIK